ncbi:hypothetical protein Goshw_009327 [Gossypium schwendimanii]|uniref:Uncharacterized protein n=1 Tax=Gossypium schwendimanii TaxID=34291 RepID=A0A7J9KKE1_GOSSC|nr:hypothetical protein [Gossypium schwendimanii]
MEFGLVIERIEEGYLERFEERILVFGEIVVVESYISSHLFLVLEEKIGEVFKVFFTFSNLHCFHS